MKTSERGKDLIKSFEGMKYKPYRLAGEVNYTVGYGHSDATIDPNKRYSKKEIDEFFNTDIIKFENNVNRYDKIYHWNQNEFDALVCFAYNLGSIDSLVSKGQRTREQIVYFWRKYCKDSRGVTLEGLLTRREAERNLFLTPVESGIIDEELISKKGR